MRGGEYTLRVVCTNSDLSDEETLIPCAAKTPEQSKIMVIGQSEKDCLSQVQTFGWKISLKNNRDFCPACVRADNHW